MLLAGTYFVRVFIISRLHNRRRRTDRMPVVVIIVIVVKRRVGRLASRVLCMIDVVVTTVSVQETYQLKSSTSYAQTQNREDKP